MPKKKQIMDLHMHQIRTFIDDKERFYKRYYQGQELTYYKGVRNAFVVGSAFDYAIKTYYENIANGADLEKGIFDCTAFRKLKKIDKTLASSLVNGYISKYHSDKKTKEYFKNVREVFWKIPIWHKKLKKDYCILASPDLIADMFNFDETYRIIIELKTSGDNPNAYSAETLDFQTMTYCWASYRWDFTVPRYVIKRSMMKPRMRQKKDETVSEFQKRLVVDVGAKSEQYFKSSVREVNKMMILEYEKYLYEILFDLDKCINPIDKYKFWKKSSVYWGL